MLSLRRFLVYLVMAIPFLSLSGRVSAKQVVVTEKDNGKAVSLHVGDTLLLRLAANPAAGINWSRKSVTPHGLLRQVGPAQYLIPPVVQAGVTGIEVYHFRAVHAGHGKIRVHHKRLASAPGVTTTQKWKLAFTVHR